MMTLEEARQNEVKLQKQTIIKFSVYVVLIIAAFVALHVFTDYFEQYTVFYPIFALLFILACKYSKIYYFLRPKEFIGVIKYSNVTIENVKTHASHQAGSTYNTKEVRMLHFVVSNDKKTVRRTIEYDWHWGEFYEGQIGRAHV